MRLEIKSNIDEVNQLLASASDRVFSLAVRRSLKETVRHLTAKVATDIQKSKQTKLLVREIKQGLVAGGNYLRSAGAAWDQLEGKVTISPKAIMIGRFNAKVRTETQSVPGQKRRRRVPVVEATILGRVKRLKAFAVRGRSLLRSGSLSRTDAVIRRTGEARYPTEAVFGPSLADIVRFSSLKKEITDRATDFYGNALSRNIRWYLANVSTKVRKTG